MKTFPHYRQLDAMDCGPTCLRMVTKHHGKNFSLQKLRASSRITREGVSLLGISEAAENIGMRTMGVRISFEQLITEAPLPCVVHWSQNHFVVLHKVSRKGGKTILHVADPAESLITYTEEEFKKQWLSTQTEGEEKGIALLIEPSPDFYKQKEDEIDKSSFKFLFSYLRPYKKYIGQLLLALLTGSLLQLIFPFLTQSVVDFGIANNNINFIYLVLAAQLVLFTAQKVSDIIRSWILLHISTRINISLISDFLIKLMKLPVSFFDTKMTGDLMQRIDDHSRIENFLTSTSLSIVFSVFNLIIFSGVLLFYSVKIFGVFVLGSIFYGVWIYFFMEKRRKLDFKRFQQLSANQSNVIQLIQGMQEIKLNNSERTKRWEWERIQAAIFKVSVKSLSLDQYQQTGSAFINEIKNIFISFLAASAVIKGEMTLGMMLAVQYIIGQMNSPITQMIGFMRSAQDAKISLERLGEIHQKEDEEKPEDEKELPENKDIRLENVSFSYSGLPSEYVLKNINLTIPANKTTAIVGTSGSGKTTLLKLLLSFYPPNKGDIKIGGMLLENYSIRYLREQFGSVMQDGFIFSDTISGNISISDERVDTKKLSHAAEMANIKEFVEGLPLRYNTKIGSDGTGISQGQKQRILIARAIYKNPQFILFDEATNSLDANNERIIMENLNTFFQGKTAVVVAHRLSTVKNADKIIVLEKGELVEEGTHAELSTLKGEYYRLVKNQLELGN